MLQKTYAVDSLTKKRIDNDGQVNQYYIENNHELILDREKWEIVQLEIARRKKFREQHKLQFYIMQKENNPFTTKVFYAECGSAFGRKNWTTSRGKRKVWQCNNRYGIKGQIGCLNNYIDEEMLEKAVVMAFSSLSVLVHVFLSPREESSDADIKNLGCLDMAVPLFDVI